MISKIQAFEQNQVSNIQESEIIAADICFQSEKQNGEAETTLFDVDAALKAVNNELDRYTNNAERIDYAIGIAGGILAGIIDATYIGEMKIMGDDIGIAHNQVNNFIMNYAHSRGFERERLKDAIVDLEHTFKVAQDNVWKGAGIGVAAKNHHLADLAHHPTPIGLISSIIVQLFRIGTFVNKEGEWHFVLIKTSASDIIEIVAPAVLTGLLNWIVSMAEEKYEIDNEKHVPEIIHKIVHIVASTPIIIQIAKIADNWFGHLVSDMGGSKNTAGDGMGIPGVFLSLLYEISAFPGFKDSGLPAFVNDLYVNHKMDLRHELVLLNKLGKQAVPVILNEIFVRGLYFVAHLAREVADHKGIQGIDWGRIIPIGNRTIDRTMMVASMTFTMADTVDAAVHAAIESSGNAVMFAGVFVARFNYVGAGRAALAIVKEISNEKKEAELIHEKMLLTQIKNQAIINEVEAYKAELEKRIAMYLAEDITDFLNGFDYIKQGMDTGDSNMVIRGNVVIQRVLGREPQFTNQNEFDDLMTSDTAFIL